MEYITKNNKSFSSDIEDRIDCLRSQALIHGHITDLEKVVIDIKVLATKLLAAVDEERRRRQYKWV